MNRPAPDPRDVSVILDGRGSLYATETLDELDQTAHRIAASGADLVAIWGGDGTVSATITALSSAYGPGQLPRLALIGGGTMNVVATALGMRGTPASALARLLVARERGVQLKEVQCSTLRVAQRLGFLFGVGLIPNFLSVYDSARAQGPLRALQVLAMGAPGLIRKDPSPDDPFFQPFDAQVSIDGKTWAGEWTNLSAGTIESLPLGFRVYPRARETPRKFHFIAHNHRTRGALVEMAWIQLGRGMQEALQRVTGHVRIEIDRALPFNLDGDNFAATDSYELRSGPTVRAVSA